MSPVREDPVASHQTSKHCAGTQVQPEKQAHSSTLSLPEKQTRRLLCPHSAGKSQTNEEVNCLTKYKNIRLSIR